MPRFQSTVCYPRPVQEVFAFFIRPANLELVSPPDFHLRVLEGPVELGLGSRITVQGRRWGVPQRITSAVTAFEPGACFVDEQVQGPLRRFVHEHRFEAIPGGTRVTDTIDFEPPGGVLGLIVTAGLIERELRHAFAYRLEQLEAHFGRMPGA